MVFVIVITNGLYVICDRKPFASYNGAQSKKQKNEMWCSTKLNFVSFVTC